jgi:anti-sigma factor RsiW
MMGHIIHLHGDQHSEARALLPWYVTGRLDASERAQVEAHLNGCPECQEDLRIERGLYAQIAGLPMDVEQGWANLRARLERDRPGRRRSIGWRRWLGVVHRAAGGSWRGGPIWLTWALVPQLGLLLLLGGLLLTTIQRGRDNAARYHLLGAAPIGAAGNVVVMFRPQTSERDLRRILEANQARVVNGPTSTDAWLLEAPAARRSAVVAKLRGEPQVTLAEPVDSAESSR